MGATDTALPPYPGERPRDLVYPFEEARAAMRAYHHLREELEAAITSRDQQLVREVFPVGRPGFSGARADRFIDEVVDLMDLVRLEIADLDDAIEELARELVLAEDHADDVAREQAQWDRDARAYADAYERLRSASSQPFGDVPGRPPPPPKTPGLPPLRRGGG